MFIVRGLRGHTSTPSRAHTHTPSNYRTRTCDARAMRATTHPKQCHPCTRGFLVFGATRRRFASPSISRVLCYGAPKVFVCLCVCVCAGCRALTVRYIPLPPDTVVIPPMPPLRRRAKQLKTRDETSRVHKQHMCAKVHLSDGDGGDGGHGDDDSNAG